VKKIRTDWSLEEPLRKLVERLIEEQPGLQITKKEHSCLIIEFCGEEMGIEAGYLDYLAEKEALYNMHRKPRATQRSFSTPIESGRQNGERTLRMGAMSMCPVGSKM